jgi:4-hydroxybenzoate polyprenyltransferase
VTTGWTRVAQSVDGLRVLRGPLFKSVLLLSAPLFLELVWPARTSSAARMWLVFIQFVVYLCFAYAVNDLADREADRLAGKQRTLGRLPAGVGILVAISLCVVTLSVAWALRPPPVYWGVLTLGLALAHAYSAPPLALKRRGLLGIVVGPVLGKTVPLLLCCILWQRWGWWVAWIAGADLMKNAVDLLFHQIVDEAADRNGGIRSYVVDVGFDRARARLRWLAWIGTGGAAAVAGTYAWFIPESRVPLALGLVVAPLAVWWLRRSQAATSGLTPRTELPAAYVVVGGAVFLLGPAAMATALAWRTPGHAPLALLVALLTALQLRFLWRYRYA